jgi:putative transposase
MIRAYKIRLYPNKEQESLLWKHVNGARYAYNWALATVMENFQNGNKHIGGYELKKLMTIHKDNNEWLKDISSQTLSQSILDLDGAYKKFFVKQKKGKKFSDKCKKRVPYNMIGHPKFKKRGKARNSFYSRANSIYFTESFVNLEKIGKVEYKTNYTLPTVSKKGHNTTKFTNPRVSYDNGKWVMSFGVEEFPSTYELTKEVLGIDLGIKTLATVSNGSVYKNPNKTKAYRKLYKRLEQKQAKYSKQVKNSKNQAKTLSNVQKLHSKIANKKKDYIHKMTTEIVKALPSAIVVEDLNVSGMMKNKKLSKHIHRANFYMILEQLKYKCEWHGIEFIKADRFYPSSKKCSSCGNIKHDLRLKDRLYKCVCGLEIDRDLNASLNLKKLANM